MDYKETLNLPKTAFPMKADLTRREPGTLEFWEKADIYGKLRRLRKGAPQYLLHDGLPLPAVEHGIRERSCEKLPGRDPLFGSVRSDRIRQSVARIAPEEAVKTGPATPAEGTEPSRRLPLPRVLCEEEGHPEGVVP